MLSLFSRKCVVCDSILDASKRTHAVYCSTRCGNRKRNRKYEVSHPDRIILNRERQNEKAETRILTRIKCRAKRDKIEFDLDVEDIIIPQQCPVLGIDIVRYHGTGKRAGYFPNSASVDRIDPSIGYVKGNIRVISARANLLKNNAELWELEAVLADLKRLRDDE